MASRPAAYDSRIDETVVGVDELVSRAFDQNKELRVASFRVPRPERDMITLVRLRRRLHPGLY